MRRAAVILVAILLSACAGPAYLTPADKTGAPKDDSGGMGGTGAVPCEEKDGGVGGTGCPASQKPEGAASSD